MKKSFCCFCLKETPSGSFKNYATFDPGVSFPGLASKPFSSLNLVAFQKYNNHAVHVNRNCASSSLPGINSKSYTFCVEHNGAEAIFRHIVNVNCLKAFMVTFIGQKSVLKVLKANGITVRRVDPIRCL